MKSLKSTLFAFALSTFAFTGQVIAQENYKHPHLNSSRHVLESTGHKLGKIGKDGTFIAFKAYVPKILQNVIIT